jgi:uncharacterized protein (TIGR02145 family)
MRITLFTFCMLLSTLLSAQAPALIPYQAIARDAAGQALVNSVVNARFTLHEGAATGAVIWQESQSITTTALGLFTVKLGSIESLTSVNWANGAKFIQVELELGGGFVDLGSQQLLSVPYALYAGSVRLNISSTGDTLFLGNSSSVIIPGISSANPNSGNEQGPFLGNVRAVDVIGRVVDESGNPVIGANVQAGYGSQSVLTDGRGFFRLLGISCYDKIALVKVSKSGYFDGARSFVPTDGQNQVRIALLAKNNAGSFNAAAGGQVSLEGVVIDFAPSSIALNGQPYSGNVNVAINSIDPSDTWSMSQQMPGSLVGANGQQLDILRSLGMAGVQLTDDSDQELQLLEGSTVTIRFEVPTSLLTDAPSTIPLWHYSESQGYWMREGEATLDGTAYEGEVSHFSFWNCDIPAEAVLFSLTVQSDTFLGNSFPMEGAFVTITSSVYGTRYGYTASNGFVSGLVPANEILEVNVYVLCGDEQIFVYSNTIGPLSSDYSTLYSVNDFPSIALLQGQLLDAFGSPVDGYVYLENGPMVSTTNGSYHMLSCTGNDVLIGFSYSGFELCSASPTSVSIMTGVNNVDLNISNCAQYGLAGSGGLDQEGNSFPSVIIGSQEWTSVNLDVATYNDGTPIPQVADNAAWAALNTGAWCWFNNDSASYAATYGRLYNWYAVAGIYDAASAADSSLRKQLAPAGWHVPTNAEWSTLMYFLDPMGAITSTNIVFSRIAGGMMRTTGTVEGGTGLWLAPNSNASNVTGFSALGGGLRNEAAGLYLSTTGRYGNFWLSTERDNDNGSTYIHNSFFNPSVGTGGTAGGMSVSKRSGRSVRCIRD